MIPPRQYKSNRRAELPRDWATIRQRILRRDGHRCVKCGAPANQVDHIGDRHQHGDENLRSLCTPCHRSRTSAQGVAVRRARAASKYRTPEPHPSERKPR